MEVEDWIDAINQPEWQRSKRQIFGPGDDPYVLEAVYKFSLNATLAGEYNSTTGGTGAAGGGDSSSASSPSTMVTSSLAGYSATASSTASY